MVQAFRVHDVGGWDHFTVNYAFEIDFCACATP